MECGFFEYTCDFFDEESMEMKTYHGLIYAEDYCDAVYEISKYYGEEFIDKLSVSALEPGCVYEFENGAVNFKLSIKEKDE